MTGIKANPKKEVQVLLTHTQDAVGSTEDGYLMSRTFIRILIAMLIIVSTTTYTILLGPSRGLTRTSHRRQPENARIACDHIIEYTDRFVEFMKNYGKEYKNSTEMLRRFKTYEKHMHDIFNFNRKSASGVTYGENEMSDWTDEEFEKSLLPISFYKQLRRDATFIRKDAPKAGERATPAPDFFDWREKNVISPVKAQGKCGSCWAFAATATVEAAWAIAHGEMRNLSEQTLLDCDLEDNACDGGDEDKAFRFLIITIS